MEGGETRVRRVEREGSHAPEIKSEVDAVDRRLIKVNQWQEP